MAGRFDELPGARAVILVHADRVSDSCGYAVPRYEYQGQRSKLIEWADHHADDIEDYRARKNAASIDGLPAFDASVTAT